MHLLKMKLIELSGHISMPISAVNVSINGKEYSFNYSHKSEEIITTNNYWSNPDVLTYELDHETN